MKLKIADTKFAMGAAAAAAGAAAISGAIARYGAANVVVATGASQFEMLAHMARAELDWGAVSLFHLDEYVGLDAGHPASFRRYLRERFIAYLPDHADFIEVRGDAADPAAEIERLNARLAGVRLDVCFVGIGENGHLAFNDPPADFVVTDPYLMVALDDACRRQQFGEGWFERLEDVPTQAITMSISRIMAARRIIATVPDRRKAEAVRRTLEEPLSPLRPASILREHPDATLFLDAAAASLLQPETLTMVQR